MTFYQSQYNEKKNINKNSFSPDKSRESPISTKYKKTRFISPSKQNETNDKNEENLTLQLTVTDQIFDSEDANEESSESDDKTQPNYWKSS